MLIVLLGELYCQLYKETIFFFGGGGVKVCDKMAISAFILKIVENDPFLRLQMRAKEMFNRHQFFPLISNT